MDRSSADNWVTGWVASDAPQIGFAFVRRDADGWQEGPRPGLRSIELDLTAASEGNFSAHRVQTVPDSMPADTDWFCHDGDFDFIYVVSGSIAIETEDGEHYTLGPGASAIHPARTWRREYDASPDLEYLRVTVPAELPTIVGRLSALPPREGTRSPQQDPVYTFDLPENYVVAAGPRRFFEYRDLETAAFTDGRIHIHVVHAVESGTSTGWHYHSMAQWFLILEGNADIEVEDKPTFQMGPLDSMCIGRGMRHDVARFSGDYKLIEMCVPADYETVGVEPPDRSSVGR